MADDPLAPENRAYLQTLEAEGHQAQHRTAQRMQRAGFFHWGFLIYRCDYSDDNLWSRFIAHARKANQQFMEVGRSARVLLPYMEWTLVEDRGKLDGATKEQVRDLFRAWRDGLSVERDGPGADGIWTPGLPRFEYCIYVGREELESLLPYERFMAEGGQIYSAPTVKFCLINAQRESVSGFQPLPGTQPPAPADDDKGSESHDEEEDEDVEDEDEEEDDEDDEDDIWWIYFGVERFGVAYAELHARNIWDRECLRPPQLSFEN